MNLRARVSIGALLTAACAELSVGERVERDWRVLRTARTWLAPPSDARRARDRLLLGDLDGDGLDDVCGRFGDAYGCARNAGSSRFERWREVPGFFTDPTDFTVATARLIYLDADARLDLCAVDRRGLACWLGDGVGGFTRLHDAAGAPLWGLTDQAASLAQYRYGATLTFLRLRPRSPRRSPCYRGPGGLRCYEADGRGLLSLVTPAAGPDDDNNGGITQPQYSETYRVGDLDGDGDDDLCRRGDTAYYCRRFEASAFLPSPPWTERFSDALGFISERYYHSHTLPDLNGDGRADACARGPGGVVCGLARQDAAGFTVEPAPVIEAWSDDAGWARSPLYYRAHVMVVDLDGDRRDDLCSVGPDLSHGDERPAVWCARSTADTRVGFEPARVVAHLPELVGPVAVGTIQRGVPGFCTVSAAGDVVCAGLP